MNRCLLLIPAALLVSCGTETKNTPAEAPKQLTEVRPKVQDESRRFPKENLVESKVVDDHIMGKPFLPGGTIAHYKKGGKEYDLFVTKVKSPTDAAIALLDYKKGLTDSKLVASFGGYFGKDGDRPVFVFSKGSWIAGVAGLSEKEADLQGRVLAGKLDQ
jgi:hypothetical protein